MRATSATAGTMAAILLLAVTAAQAGEDSAAKHRKGRPENGHAGNGHGANTMFRRDIVGGSGLPSVIGGLGTFAGSVSAVRVRGNGLYVASDLQVMPAAAPPAPRARIITVAEGADAFLPRQPCAYEAGVCVIRGGR
ncbi:hypothetical protein [Rhizobium sp. CSW-27]|uniref:hypothetical protein n=1 Tax=Rhizobium sp. CSW-27 TaxID=2839985 RepID=UPI001C0376ED|nr:hypothetical protein [Rhizobium sp. CSW-27]MBT9370704.1 hypothetical protein [Rhizobium sp. CSW-27]